MASTGKTDGKHIVIGTRLTDSRSCPQISKSDGQTGCSNGKKTDASLVIISPFKQNRNKGEVNRKGNKGYGYGLRVDFAGKSGVPNRRRPYRPTIFTNI